MADRKDSLVKIDASEVYCRELNTRLRDAVPSGAAILNSITFMGKDILAPTWIGQWSLGYLVLRAMT